MQGIWELKCITEPNSAASHKGNAIGLSIFYEMQIEIILVKELREI